MSGLPAKVDPIALSSSKSTSKYSRSRIIMGTIEHTIGNRSTFVRFNTVPPTVMRKECQNYFKMAFVHRYLILPKFSYIALFGLLAILLVASIAYPVTGAEILFGSTSGGTIESPGSTDEYSFPVESGDEIFVRAHSTSDTLSSLSMEVNGTSGATTTSLRNANGLGQVKVLHVTTSGTCSLVVGADNDQTGDYSVYLQRLNDPVGSQSLVFGTATNGSITTSADMVTYAFSGAGQDVIKAWMASDWKEYGKDEFLYLFRTDGVLVSSSATLDGAITGTLPSSSEYVLLAGGDGSRWANDSGSFDLFTQRVNNPGNAVALEYGTTIQDSIDNVLAWKTYAFSLNADDTIFVRLSQNSAQSGNEWLYAFGPDGADLTGQGTEGPIAQTFHATQTGTYTFIVGASWYRLAQTGGGYSLFVQRLNNPVNSQAPLAFGTAQTATITTNGEMDTYTISGTEQDVLTVWLFGDWWNSRKGNLLYLYRDDGLLVAQSRIDSWMGSDGNGWTARGYVSTPLPSPGNYVLLVGGAGSNWQISGTYQLYAQWTNRPANATQIAFGDYIAGSISTPGKVDAYTFAAQQGDPIYVSLSTGQSVNRWLYAPNGTEMGLGGGEWWQREISLIVPETGAYTIVVADDGGDQLTGDYGLYLQRLASPVNAAPIEFGQPINRSIDRMGQTYVYSLSGNAGDVIVGRVGSLQFHPVVRVYDPSGTLLGDYADEWNSDYSTPNLQEFTLSLPVSGTYTILIPELFGMNTGGYGLTIQRMNHPENTVSIGFKETVAGTFNTSAEIDTYVFGAQKGDLLHAGSDSQFTDGNVAFLRFYSSNGTLLAASTPDSWWQGLSLKAPETGSYSLLVVGNRGGGTGPYTLDLSNERPVQMLAGQSYRGNISADARTSWDYYCLDTSGGEDLLVQVIPDTASADLELYGSLNSPPTTTSFDFRQNEKTTSGMYELLISPTENGTYWFGLRATEGTTGYTIRAVGNGGNHISNIYPAVVDTGVETRIQVYGLGFVPGMQVRLANNGTTIAAAGSTILASTTMIVSLFDLSAVSLGTYDLVVEWPDHTIQTVPSAIQVKALPGGVRYREKELSVGAGQTVTVPYNLVDSPRNLFVTLQKIKYGGDPHYNWQGTLTVRCDGVVVGTDSGNQDHMVHLVNPIPGNYTIDVKAESEAGQAILTVWDELPVLTPGEWVVDRVLRPYGSVYHQIDIPMGTETLRFDAQAIGGYSRFIVYHGKWKNGTAWLSSQGPDASLTIDDPPSGLYIVEFQDTQQVTGDDQARDVMVRASTMGSNEPLPWLPPEIFSITPAQAGNAGTVTFTLEGQNLDPNASVSLGAPWQNNISATVVQGEKSRTKILATFDLFGTVPGRYSMAVVASDGVTITRPDAVEIVDGGEADLQMEVIGPSDVRIGRWITNSVRFTNTGSIDGQVPVVKVEAPEVGMGFTSMRLKNGFVYDDGTFGYIDPAPQRLNCTDPVGAPVTLAPGGVFVMEWEQALRDTGEKKAKVTALGSNQIHVPSTITSSIDAAFPAPGIPLTFSRMFPATYTKYRGPFGYGWVHSFDMHLERVDRASYVLRVGEMDSTFFRATCEGTFINDTSQARLVLNGDGTCSIKEDDGSEMVFTAPTGAGSLNPLGFLLSVQDDNDNRITCDYSGGRLTTIRHSNGKSIQLSYDYPFRDNLITAVTDPSGRTTTFRYRPAESFYVEDKYEVLSDVIHPDGTTVHYDYEPLFPRGVGSIGTSSTNGGGGMGGGVFLILPINKYDYFTLTKVVLPNGEQQVFSVSNQTGRLTESFTLGSDGNTIQGNRYNGMKVSYDDSSGTTSFTNDIGATSSTTLNNFGGTVSQRSPSGNEIRWTYGPNRLVSSKTDPMGNTFVYRYDAHDRLQAITDPNGNTGMLEYEGESDRVVSVTDKRSNTHTYLYQNNDPVRITFPDQTVVYMDYDSVGNKIRSVSRNGDTIKFTYSVDGQLLRKEYPDQTATTFTYDSRGNLLTATDKHGTIRMEYDQADRLAKVQNPTGESFQYKYDQLGRLIRRVDNFGTATNYQYTPAGLLLRIFSDDNREIVTYSYDSANRLVRKGLPNGLHTEYVYDTDDRLLELVNYHANNSVLSKFTYQYDGNGNSISMTRDNQRWQYEYDSMNRLIAIVDPAGQQLTYNYDAAGNRISVVDRGIVTNYQTNQMNQYLVSGATSYRYDNNGNMIEHTTGNQTCSYEYDIENRLVSIDDGNNQWRFEYDALGNRIRVTENGNVKRVTVEPIGLHNIVAEYDATGNLTARYTYGLGLLSQIDPRGQEQYYLFDKLGHTTEIVNVSGNVQNKYRYLPYGETLDETESIPNSFTYLGEYGGVGDSSGLSFIHLRYYSPQLGRFITEDPIYTPLTNPYLYANNNPVDNIDPTGGAAVNTDGIEWEAFKQAWAETSLSDKIIMTTYGIEVGLAIGCYYFPTAASGVTSGGFLAETSFYQTEMMYEGVIRGCLNRQLLAPLMPYAPIITGIGGALEQLLGPKGPIFPPYSFPPIGGFALGYINDHLSENGMPGNFLTDISVKIAQWLMDLFGRDSLDPEDKFGPAGFDFNNTPYSERQNWLPETKHLDYHVDFWNAENATAPVCDVLAFDQLDQDLDWSTFRFNEVGFMNWSVPLDGAPSFDVYVDTRPAMPYYVHINGAINQRTGNVTLEYHTLDATTLEQPEDSLAGFLPPITSEGSELGWFDYTINPKADLPTGTRIENRAWVNFDYSKYMPAPPDGPWVNTIDRGAPASRITSATVVNKTELHLQWTGNDDAGGVGVYDYRVFASIDGGQYLPIVESSTESSAVVSALPGHTYRLYTVAMDYVGNVEDAPPGADQTVAVPETAIADFTATPTNGSAPMTVYFADISTGEANKWSWSFGDGATSNLESPSHIYQQPGMYDVSLRVTGAGGATDTISRKAYITLTGWAPNTQTPTPTPVLGLVTVPGGTGLPRDLNGDGRYEDINGNGRKDFADVVLYFNQMTWIAAHEPAGALDFDYNNNDRIDFADVVWLFNHL
ncbi:MAG: RHS repeat-associated core domain-containing protein [Methanospirillum sp.]